MGEPFRIRSLLSPLYLPNFLFSVGRGVAVPVIALLALELGASPAMAGAVVAVRGLGTVIFDVPAGILVSRLGERRAMVVAGVAQSVIAVTISLRPPLWLYAFLIALLGCTWSVWHVARIAYAAGSSAVSHRGRVMSILGGSTRVGQLVGPLLGALVIDRAGLPAAFALVAGVVAVASLATMASRSPSFVPEPFQASPPPGVVAVVRAHRQALLTAGSVALAAQVLRSSREVLIPLWGDMLGIQAATIQIIFAASYAVESVAFYPVGVLMDRKGRKWAIAPCIALLSVGIALIPAAATVETLSAVAMLIGLANGLGSGINMTLGSDLAPLSGRSRFLGVWRVITDLGNLGGPLLVAAVTSAAALAAAAWTVGGVGVVGLIVLWRLVPETLTGGPDGMSEGAAG